MKRSTTFALIKYLKEHILRDKNCFNLFEMYKLYSREEVDSVELLMSSADDFCNFLLDNLDKANCPAIYKFAYPIAISKFHRILSELLSPQTVDRQLLFTSVVKDVLPSGNQTKVLDVASGNIPLSSIMLAERMGNTVSSMDKFFVDTKTLESLNVDGRDEMFNLSTDISDFGLIIGNKPCEATFDMIQSCAQSNMPYFINLCACNFLKKDKFGEEILNPEWKDQLIQLDRRIKFYRDESTSEEYAFVLDATPAQVGKIIEINKMIENNANIISDFLEDLLDSFISINLFGKN